MYDASMRSTEIATRIISLLRVSMDRTQSAAVCVIEYFRKHVDHQ